jgi:hypothetical protein
MHRPGKVPKRSSLAVLFDREPALGERAMFQTNRIRLAMGCVVFLALLWAGSPAVSAAPTNTASNHPSAIRNHQLEKLVLAESWSMGKFLSGAGSRTRVVQICVVVMCIALFIMIRKFND